MLGAYFTGDDDLLTEAVHLVDISVRKLQKYQARSCESAPRFLTTT